MKKEFVVGFLALIAQLAGIISILAIIGFFYGAEDAMSILFVSVPLFIVSFAIVTKIKSGLSWLIAWSFPWPL